MPTGNIELLFSRSGSAYTGEKQGLASLSSALLNEGTKELGATKFADLLEQDAITLHAYSTKEFLEISLSFLKEKQAQSLKLLGDLLKSPNLTKNTLEKLQKQTISSILANESNFDYLANLGLSQILFANTPLQYPAIGTIPSVKSITLDQIKEHLSSSLSLKRLSIIIGGDMDIDSTLQELSNILSTLPIGNKPALTAYQANSTTQTKTQYKPTEQAYIYFGTPFHLKNYKEEAHKAKVMSFILGASGFGSRMMETIRVKHGLAYSAYMRINLSPLANYATGYMQTKISNQTQSIQLVREIIEEFVKNGATQEELDGAKNFLLGSEPLRNETLSQRLDSAFANYNRGLELDYNKIELQKIQDLTLKELNDYIKSHKEILELSFSIITE
ncbi:peptidase M16 [Helicobacter enhydrae]|uniref:Peptidase M16 n=1 Tax=Helicobacter enhydrae TaxID=222136 RepID=A0A1B1U7H8_9HELI|nr:peptidase M16 [Helicobacter enhydrae]